MGLNKWATELANGRGVKRTATENRWTGMFIEEGGHLFRYTLPNKRVFYEYIQADPWSSGPCIFLALKDAKGKPVRESLWPKETIDNC